MIGRTRPRVRRRQRRVDLKWARHWVSVGVILWAAAAATVSAAEPQAPQSAAPQGAPPHAATAEPPDEDFIEFLGKDDVGDAAWWEFLKRAPPRRASAPPSPPQETRQQ